MRIYITYGRSMLKMAEGGESGYEADLESEYESKNESNEESHAVSLIPDIIYTGRGHRMESEYPISNLTFGHPLKKSIDFETRCPTFSTTWWCEVELERAENNGPISYWIRMQRIDTGDQKMNAAACIRFRHAASKDFFHEEGFESDGMMVKHEIRGRGAVPCAKLQKLPNNELVLRVDMIARLCHGNIKRKRESSSSTDNR